jgi:hypothetical protein
MTPEISEFFFQSSGQTKCHNLPVFGLLGRKHEPAKCLSSDRVNIKRRHGSPHLVWSCTAVTTPFSTYT